MGQKMSCYLCGAQTTADNYCNNCMDTVEFADRFLAALRKVRVSDPKATLNDARALLAKEDGELQRQ
jgi:hypothetical protein